jgi:hypothetical protein
MLHRTTRTHLSKTNKNNDMNFKDSLYAWLIGTKRYTRYCLRKTRLLAWISARLFVIGLSDPVYCAETLLSRYEAVQRTAFTVWSRPMMIWLHVVAATIMFPIMFADMVYFLYFYVIIKKQRDGK